MSDTPETVEAVERWQQGKINIFDEMARLEIERNSLQDQRDFAMGEIERLRKERDEARKSEIAAIAEREKWRMQAEQKWAMRRELEEILGVSEGSACDEQFAKGMEALRKLKAERDEAREAFATATNHAIEAREMLRRIMDWSPCLPEYEPDAQHLKWQSDAHAARKFLEAAK